jgi:hypothetical protein
MPKVYSPAGVIGALRNGTGCAAQGAASIKVSASGPNHLIVLDVMARRVVAKCAALMSRGALQDLVN